VAAQLTAPDSSVLIAGYAPEHPFHEAVTPGLRAVKKRGALIAHTMAETYSILTGQAYGHPPTYVLRYLDQFLEHQPVGLKPASYAKVLQTLADGGIVGGSIYDGLIAAAAKQAGLHLLSLDRRAARTYAMLGIDYEILI
jgi:predicted nucleic acid-binding protein